MPTQDLTGNSYGRLTVVSVAQKPAHVKSNSTWWTCRCSCGEETIAQASSLKLKQKTSCGCLRRRSYEQISGEYLCSLRHGAKSRGIEYCVEPPYLWNLFNSQGGKCAFSGADICFSTCLRNQTASLDRIDSKAGYTPGNLQWVHKTVNMMKNKLPDSRFLEFVKLIYENRLRS